MPSAPPLCAPSSTGWPEGCTRRLVVEGIMERDPERPPESCGIDTLGRQLSLALLLTRAAPLAGWVRAVPPDRRCAGSAVTGCLVSMCAGSERQPESALVIGGTLWIVAPAATSP